MHSLGANGRNNTSAWCMPAVSFIKQNIDSLTKKLQVGSVSNSCPLFLIVLGATGCNALTNHASHCIRWWKHAPSWRQQRPSYEPLRSQKFAPSCMPVPFADHQWSVHLKECWPSGACWEQEPKQARSLKLCSTWSFTHFCTPAHRLLWDFWPPTLSCDCAVHWPYFTPLVALLDRSTHLLGTACNPLMNHLEVKDLHYPACRCLLQTTNGAFTWKNAENAENAG